MLHTTILAWLSLLRPPFARVVSSKAAGLLGFPPPKGPVVIWVSRRVTRRVVDAVGEQAAGAAAATLTVSVVQTDAQVPS